MKKTILLITSLALAAPLTNAQSLQNLHKTSVFADEWSGCADSYTQWSVPLFDTLAAIENTKALPAYFLQFNTGPTYGLTNLWWSDGALYDGNNSPNYGQPSLAVNNKCVNITEIGYEEFNAAGTACIYPKVIDSLNYYIAKTTAAPAEVSIGFNKTMVTSDSIVIDTKTRFNINDKGLFSVAVYAVQDSAWGYNASTIPGKDSFYHRNLIRRDVQWGVWGMQIVSDTNVYAGDEFVQSYTCKAPADWNLSKMHYVMLVYKWSADYKWKTLLNITDGNFDNSPLGTQDIANTDITGSMKVYPVPAKNYLNVEMQIDKPLENSTICLYDITGKKIAQLFTGTVHPATQLTLQLPQDIPAGNYMLQLINQNVSAVKQVTIK